MFKSDIARFLIVGLLTVIVDFLIYIALISFFGAHKDLSKMISFILGAFFAYLANKNWTFQSEKQVSHTILPFVMLYLSTLLVNVLVNKVVIYSLEGSFVFYVAFLCATVLSAALNYFGMKFIVFKKI